MRVPFRRKGHRHLNGWSSVSQLYSHWKRDHKTNEAASILEKRWRLANEVTANGKKQLKNLRELLDAKCPLILSNEEMERLGGPDKGFEQVRAPTPSTADFKHRFDLNTVEHHAWLQAAVGCI